MPTTMPKYITTPNGGKLVVFKDKSSASGYSAVPAEMLHPVRRNFQNMPLSVNNRNAVIKRETSKAAAFKEYKASTSKSSSKSRTASKTSRKK